MFLSNVSRVALEENVHIPAESMVIVTGKPLDSLDRKRLGVVEPPMKFVQIPVLW